MKTVGIIGGSGFIGSHTTKQFLEHGYNVKTAAIKHFLNPLKARVFRAIVIFIPSTNLDSIGKHIA